MSAKRIPLLYLAPWVDYGGSDTNTLDWFRWMDRSRFSVSLITTQPSENRRLSELAPFASEVWALPELMEGKHFPQFIAEFIVSREIEVVHLMNSRIGFDLLPDLRALKRPPKVVVQLHVEEPTRDGYVRYVTTRYGNLVDAYSVSSAHVGDAVVGYGVPRERVVTIPTGIDAALFNRQRVTPSGGLADDVVHLLYIARLVPQKDPLLMVEVARELQSREHSFCIHVIGGGELEDAVRARVAEYGLEELVVFEPSAHELRPWYAAADLMLMTSVFEGVPVIVYEALAMEVPIVAPALVGIAELMSDAGGTLVAERDRASNYADALEPLIRSRELRRRVGGEGRELVERRFSVQEMAAEHGRLYDRLLAERPPRAGATEAWRERSRFSSRPARGTPRVSVITPCFNHGRVLRECMQSIRAQSYPDVELIVIDDCSTDGQTKAYLSELDREDGVHVLHLERNEGPSAARNRGIRLATGRYVLPVDSDNLLLPDAIERLVAQLQTCGEHVGFIYQNCQYFGNREDYFEAPVYNPWLLVRQNFIDTCALIDREVFERGFAYAEDIVLGHEDWDFFLQLADHGIAGEPARGKTLLYRKEGFTRSDLVEWTGAPFQPELVERHPTLFPQRVRNERVSDYALGLKARWAPALSLIALAPLEAQGPAWELARTRILAQQFSDYELLIPLDHDVEDSEGGPAVHGLPRRPGASPADVLTRALDMSRGRHLMITDRALPDLMADPGSIERIVRLLERTQRRAAFCFADSRTDAHPFAVIHGDDPEIEPHTLAFSRAEVVRSSTLQAILPSLDASDPIGGLCRWMQLERHHIEWRHISSEWSTRRTPTGVFKKAVVPPEGPRAERVERELRVIEEPIYSGSTASVERWEAAPTWLPAATAPLVRHQRFGFEQWAVASTKPPPNGYLPEHYLGVVHMRALQGTRRIVASDQQGYAAVPIGAEPTGEEMERSFGYADEVAFTMLEPLLLCRHVGTGAHVLICGEDDPLRGAVEWPPLDVLGYIDRFPISPRQVPTTPPTRAWLRGLLRTVDPQARRHRLALNRANANEASWELGALLDRDPGGGIATWVDTDGRLHTEHYSPTRRPFDMARTLRWVGAPASWRGFGSRQARARATARRGVEAIRHVATRPGLSGRSARVDEEQAWLLAEPGRDRCALYSAVHPISADQLVTRDPAEALELGYGRAQILGYALALAPVTGTLQRPALGIPWGSRFGEALTFSGDPLGDRP